MFSSLHCADASRLRVPRAVFGRWNKKMSAERNLGLPTALLSRFDLTFIILDKPDVSLASPC